MRTGIGIYVKNSAEAVKLYCEAFSLTLGYHVRNDDGSFYHSELYRGDTEIIDVIERDNSGQLPVDNIVQVSIILDSEDEVKKAYDLLCASGGRIDIPLGPLPWSPCAASLFDGFGVWWYISAPQHLPDETFDPKKPIEEQV